MTELQTQVIVGVVMSYVLQLLKKAAWFPWLTSRTDDFIKNVWAIGVAACSAIAISATYDPTLGQLTITGLTWAGLWNGLVSFLTSLIAQHGTYMTMIRPKQKEEAL